MSELTPEEAGRVADEIRASRVVARVDGARTPEQPSETEELTQEEADELAERIGRGGSW